MVTRTHTNNALTVLTLTVLTLTVLTLTVLTLTVLTLTVLTLTAHITVTPALVVKCGRAVVVATTLWLQLCKCQCQ